MRTIRGYESQANKLVKGELKHFFMGTRGYAKNWPKGHLLQIGYKPKGLTRGTKKEEPRLGKTKGCYAGDKEIVESRIRQGNPFDFLLM